MNSNTTSLLSMRTVCGWDPGARQHVELIPDPAWPSAVEMAAQAARDNAAARDSAAQSSAAARRGAEREFLAITLTGMHDMGAAASFDSYSDNDFAYVLSHLLMAAALEVMCLGPHHWTVHPQGSRWSR